MIDFIIHTTQYIFIGFILAYFTGVIETLLHEIGHYIVIKIIAKNTEDDNKKLRKILYLFATVFIIIGLCFIFENTKFYKGFFNAFN